MWWLMAALPSAFSSNRCCLIKTPDASGVFLPLNQHQCSYVLVRLRDETIEVT